MKYSPEAIRAARSADLVEWLKKNGFKLKKENSNYRLPGHGGLVIKENKWIHFSTKKQGNTLDFLTTILGFTFKEAMEKLIGDADYSLPTVQAPKQVVFEVPQKHVNARRVIAYLTKTRKISVSLVIELIRQGLIWQDDRGNCVFPSRNNEGSVVGAILRGTLTEKRWVGVTPGSDKSWGWLWPGPGPGLVVTESPIEAMSLLLLREDLAGNNFLALGGLRWEAVRLYVEAKQPPWVALGLNTDCYALQATEEIKNWLQDRGIRTLIRKPHLKDWNADLVAMASGCTPLDI